MTQKSSVPAKKVPNSVPHLKGNGEKIFTSRELKFLRAYSHTCDEISALEEAGIQRNRLSEIIDEPHVAAEMKKIQEVWRYQSRLTAGYSAGNHMRLMQKIEDEYDTAVSVANKAKFAPTLARMSDSAMKATNLIGSHESEKMPTVIINVEPSAIGVESKPTVIEGSSNEE